MRPCRITVLWLDADPVVAAAAVEPVLRRRWDAARVEPVLAGPMARGEPGRWDWFD
jgi:hypothetical protein